MKSVVLGVFGIHKQGVGTLLLWVVGPGLQGLRNLLLFGTSPPCRALVLKFFLPSKNG